MRILFLTPTLELGGSEILTISCARGLKAMGHEPAIAYGFDDLRLPVVLSAGIPAIRLSSHQLALRSMPRWTLALRRAIADFRPDVIHAQSMKSALISRCAAPGLPLLATVHGIESKDEWLAALILRGVRARVTAVSEESAAGVRRHRIAPPVEVLRPGIDLDALVVNAAQPAVGAATGHPRFCCPARQHRAKGVDILIAAFAEVQAKLPFATLTLVGAGEDSIANGRIVRALGLSAVVSQVGTVSDAAPYMRAADVVVLPSRREGLPLSALEALALERPVVATAVGGTPTVIRDGETGWLVPPEDSSALAAAMIAAASDGTRAREFAAAGHRLVESCFSAAAMVTRLESLLMELTSL